MKFLAWCVWLSTIQLASARLAGVCTVRDRNHKKHWGRCLSYDGCWNGVSVPGSPNCFDDVPKTFCCLETIPCTNPSFLFHCLNPDKVCSWDFPDGILDPDPSLCPFANSKCCRTSTGPIIKTFIPPSDNSILAPLSENLVAPASSEEFVFDEILSDAENNLFSGDGTEYFTWMIEPDLITARFLENTIRCYESAFIPHILYP